MARGALSPDIRRSFGAEPAPFENGSTMSNFVGKRGKKRFLNPSVGHVHKTLIKSPLRWLSIQHWRVYPVLFVLLHADALSEKLAVVTVDRHAIVEDFDGITTRTEGDTDDRYGGNQSIFRTFLSNLCVCITCVCR